MRKRTLLFRKLREHWMRFLALIIMIISLGGMFWILGTTLTRGASVLSWDFLTESSKPYGVEPSGIANAILGTICITLTATALTLPFALAGGIWLAEYGRSGKLATAIRFCVNVTMGIPSIITGLFIYAVFVVPTGHFSGFAGSLALGIIMFPIIMKTTEDMLLLVPDSYREAALALGMNRWRATIAVICRCAKSGLTTGILMALARVSGETAPLLFTALWSNSGCGRFFTGPTPNIPVIITEYTTNSPYEAQQAAGWGAALVMMTGILLINISVRFLFSRKETH